MRVILKSAGIFLIAFFIGATFYYLFSSRTTNVEIQPTFNKQPVLSDVPTEKTASKPELKIFDVENIFDENESKNYNKDFLETGEVFNFEDFKVKSGEIWMGLFRENNKQVLRETKLKIKSAVKDSIDWKNIFVNEKSEPLFLVKKKKLKSGEVKTLFRGLTYEELDDSNPETTAMKDGFSKRFYLNKTEYTLRVEKGVDTDQREILVLILETADKSQIIHYINYAGEGDYVGNLFWVGDLDRDGKLDLYMDFWNYEKGYYTSGIFLSSEAEKGKLVKKSTYLMYGGC